MILVFYWHGAIKVHFIANSCGLDDFMCQLGWITGCPDIWLNLIFECVYESVSGWAFEWVDWLGSPPPVRVSITQSVDGLNSTKRHRQRAFGFSLPDPWAESLVSSCSWTENYSMSSPSSQEMQLADGRTWDFSASIIVWANSST